MIDQFFGIHPAVIRSGLWAKMRPGEKDLYVYLMEQSERYCTRELKRTDEEIHAGVGAPARTLCRARKCLAELGLIQYQKTGGNKVLYVICDPTTRAPYPGSPRTKVPYQPAQAKSLPDAVPVPEVGPMLAPTMPAPVAPRLEEVKPVTVQAKCLESATVQQGQVDQCSEAEPVCPIHQNKYVYFDGADEKHCQLCDPSPYAPPDFPALSLTRLQDVATGHDQSNAQRRAPQKTRRVEYATSKRVEAEEVRSAGMTADGLPGLFP
jgi:hypothetical protein